MDNLEATTLDEMQAIFYSDPSNIYHAYGLLLIARQYWRDGMIGDESFDAIVSQIQEFLRPDFIPDLTKK